MRAEVIDINGERPDLEVELQRFRRPSAGYAKLKGATKRKGRDWSKGSPKPVRGGGRS